MAEPDPLEDVSLATLNTEESVMSSPLESDRAGVATLLFFFAASIVIGVSLAFLGGGADRASVASNDGRAVVERATAQ
jgi:hypothetical protein